MLKNTRKILIILVLAILFVCFTNNSYARGSIFTAKTLEYFDGIPYQPSFPALIYRTFVSAHESTENTYNANKNLKKSEDGWVYIQGNDVSDEDKAINKKWLVIQTDEAGNIIGWPPSGTLKMGTLNTTFRTYSTYFHANENTLYGENDKDGTFKYISYKTTAQVEEGELSIKWEERTINKISRIDSETLNYKGYFDQPAYGNYLVGELIRNYMNRDQSKLNENRNI